MSWFPQSEEVPKSVSGNYHWRIDYSLEGINSKVIRRIVLTYTRHYFILRTTLGDRPCYHLHFTDKKTESERGEVTCLGEHRKKGIGLEPEPRQPSSRLHVSTLPHHSSMMGPAMLPLQDILKWPDFKSKGNHWLVQRRQINWLCFLFDNFTYNLPKLEG